ncbi:hypothetical protein Dimus_007987 [Dionaea muscipula]
MLAAPSDGGRRWYDGGAGVDPCLSRGSWIRWPLPSAVLLVSGSSGQELLVGASKSGQRKSEDGNVSLG